MDKNIIAKKIAEGETALGIEFGSTRIKAVLTVGNMPAAQGGHGWENRLENGIWTYSVDDITEGLQDCFADLLKNVREEYGVELTTVGAMGISAMMHGYMAFDENDNLLVPFRTWRNTMTAAESEKLTALFNYPIPQRWSISHLWHAVKGKEEHIGKIRFFTTLAGYVHMLLTGEKVLGAGDASGMFPIDIKTCDFNKDMIAKFNALSAKEGFDTPLETILPKVLPAGKNAGYLTEAGAKLLDPTGGFKAGAPLCPPEGDAGTGMTATDSVLPGTGNCSAGTSVFAMVVLKNELSRVYPEIDLVTTPDGALTAMVHCNNCTSEINAWASLFAEFAAAAGLSGINAHNIMFEAAAGGEPDCGGLFACNYLSGEHVTGFEEGRPMFARTPDGNMNLANFCRVQLYTALGALKTGLDILLKKENVQIDRLLGHGGFFKTPKVGQSILAAAVNAPVTVNSAAGEGGAWGAALLASYMATGEGMTLPTFLEEKVFAGTDSVTLSPVPEEVEGFDRFMQVYSAGLKIERAAVEALK